MKTTLSEVEFTQKVTNKTQNKQIQKGEPTNIRNRCGTQSTRNK